MNEARFCARWFFGAMIVFPALAYLFSGAGLLVLSAFGMPVVSQSGELNRSVWLAVGLALAFVLFTLAVGRWGAPRELWLVATAWAVLQVLRLVDVAVFSYTGGTPRRVLRDDVGPWHAVLRGVSVQVDVALRRRHHRLPPRCGARMLGGLAMESAITGGRP
jgi:hypothetical protein